MFASIMHAHTTARVMRLRHIRDGKELTPLNLNNAYDFDYQQITLMQEEITMLPGDSFIAQCTYNTTERAYLITGGQSTFEEMCVNFIFYYPRIPTMNWCGTFHLTDDHDQWFEESENKGYYDPDSNFYDINVDGALDHYMSYVEDDKYLRYQYCSGDASGIIKIPIDDEEFEAYVDPIDYDCDAQDDEDEVTTDDSGFSFELDSWYSIVGICFIVFIILTIIIFVHRKIKKKNVNNYVDLDETAR